MICELHDFRCITAFFLDYLYLYNYLVFAQTTYVNPNSKRERVPSSVQFNGGIVLNQICLSRNQHYKAKLDI